MNIPGNRLPMPPPVPPCCGRAPNPLLPGTLQWPLPLLKEWFNSRADSLVDMTIERLGGLSGLYRLPDGGIPLLDLSDEVRTILGNKADRATTLAGYGIADAYTRAETGAAISAAVSAEASARDAAISGAVSAVRDSAPEAFDTLKEISDWIGDAGSGAQAVIDQVANKVDKVAGKGLSSNDYTTAEKEKLSGVEAGAKDNVIEAASVSAFSQTGAAGKIYVAKDENKAYRWNGSQYVQMGGGSSVEVVPPSTNPADAGKAADAKATGDALAGKLSKAEAEAGFTEWSVSGLAEGETIVKSPFWVSDDGIWYLETSVNIYATPLGETAVSDSLTFRDLTHTITATRTRLPTMADIPTKTSDLTNDSGFIAQHQQLVPEYSQWTCNPPALAGETLSVAELADMYELRADDYPISVVVKTGGETSLTFSERGVTAIRTVIGYTLGDQTTKPLQPKGDYAPATNIPASALSQAVQTSLGKADTAAQPSALVDKLDSASAAPAFSESATYNAGDYVTYSGKLYVCSTAVTAAGAWNAADWTAKDMTSPDATLDIMSSGRLRVVAADGETLWAQGYDLASESAITLACDKVNYFAFPATTAAVFSDATAYAVGDRVVYDGKVYKFTAAHAAGVWIGTDAEEDPDTQAFTMPSPVAGKVGDFGLDVDNGANTVEVCISLDGLDVSYSVVVPKGESLTDMLTFAGGEMAELYFTLTAFKVNGLPTWAVAKRVVEGA